MDDPADPLITMTLLIDSWLNGLNGEPENTFLLQRYGVSEAKQAARGAESTIEAGNQLRDWFIDRLTVDPGVPGPFGGLAADILVLALDMVDWEQVAHNVRSDPLSA